MICYKDMQRPRPLITVINRFVLVVAITFTVVERASPQSSVPATRAWGPSTDGLRIAISATPTTPPSTSPEFLISIQNISKADFVVNLGSMLGNGKVMFPEAVRLVLTDPAGDTRELQFFDRRYPGIAGRLDDFTVALRAGAAYEFPGSSFRRRDSSFARCRRHKCMVTKQAVSSGLSQPTAPMLAAVRCASHG